MDSEVHRSFRRRSHTGDNVTAPDFVKVGRNTEASLRGRWGESAGSISVAMQILANNGNSEGLFRGAFMQSGGPISWKTVTLEEGERISDFIVHLV